jgi:hypothetical protein
LGHVELLALGSEDASDKQIDLFFEQLDLLTLSLIVSFEITDPSFFLSDEFLKCNFL